MYLDAKYGRGCQHCEVGVDIEEIETKDCARVRLCVECVLVWFEGKDITWWEANHALFRDHVSDRIRAARKRELEAWEKWIKAMTQEEKVAVGY